MSTISKIHDKLSLEELLTTQADYLKRNEAGEIVLITIYPNIIVGAPLKISYSLVVVYNEAKVPS